MTIWTALDPATVENGCMQVAPGSHRHGVINEMHFPSEADQAKYAREEDCIYLEAEAGEAILLNNLLLHRSARNPTGKPRRGVQHRLHGRVHAGGQDRRDLPRHLR